MVLSHRSSSQPEGVAKLQQRVGAPTAAHSKHEFWCASARARDMQPSTRVEKGQGVVVGHLRGEREGQKWRLGAEDITSCWGHEKGLEL